MQACPFSLVYLYNAILRDNPCPPFVLCTLYKFFRYTYTLICIIRYYVTEIIERVCESYRYAKGHEILDFSSSYMHRTVFSLLSQPIQKKYIYIYLQRKLKTLLHTRANVDSLWKISRQKTCSRQHFTLTFSKKKAKAYIRYSFSHRESLPRVRE